ncbi:MAG: DUF5522 domain-containing protein [Ferruginibacter sp.]
MDTLNEGEDYYFNEDGFMVLTKKYLLDRGNCCGNGCKHCPYNFVNVAEPKKAELINALVVKE